MTAVKITTTKYININNTSKNNNNNKINNNYPYTSFSIISVYCRMQTGDPYED